MSFLSPFCPSWREYSFGAARSQPDRNFCVMALMDRVLLGQGWREGNSGPLRLLIHDSRLSLPKTLRFFQLISPVFYFRISLLFSKHTLPTINTLLRRESQAGLCVRVVLKCFPLCSLSLSPEGILNFLRKE